MSITFEHLEYRYPSSPAPALRIPHLAIEDRTFCLVAGPSAGGKSTLLRTINGLIPQFHGGVLTGCVQVDGRDPARVPTREMARVAGMVFQEPEAQGVADTVVDEVAFAMEQHGVARAEMQRRIDWLLDALGIEHLRQRRLATLSGGERQRVAIASVLALQPSILLLDEPTSQLDRAGAQAVIAAIEQLHRELDLTVVLAEHRLERLLPMVDHVIDVRDGEASMLTPREAAARLEGAPAVSRLARRLGMNPIPVSVAEAAHALPRTISVAPRPSATPGQRLMRVERLTVRYGGFEALADLSFELGEGEIVALTGANGSGKTTLFRALAGITAPSAGCVQFRNRPAPTSVAARTAFAALVPQDPALALYHDSVGQEISETLRFRRIADTDAATTRCLDAWALSALERRNPRDLSVGQQQRVAIAAMLPHEPPVWLLDEPTRGADAPARAWLAKQLQAHAVGGGAAIVATHDFESAATYATRVIGLESGRLAFDLAAREAFAAAGPCTTQTAQLVPGAITPDEVRI